MAFISAVLDKTGVVSIDRDHPTLAPLPPIVPPADQDESGADLAAVVGAVVSEDPLYQPNYDPQAARILVVCPATLLDNWAAEFAKWGTFRWAFRTVLSAFFSVS